MDKIYTVTCTFKYVVVANNPVHAGQVAKKQVHAAFGDADYDIMDYKLQEGMHAEGWDDECFPYGDVWDLTIADYLRGRDDDE